MIDAFSMNIGDALDYLDLFPIYEYQYGLTNSIWSLGGNRLEPISRAENLGAFPQLECWKTGMME